MWYAIRSVAEDDRDDIVLLRAWSSGDRAAGETLFVRHVHRLSRFFRAKGFGDVDDLIQSTLLGCLEAAPQFRGDADFSVLLFQIARRRVIDQLRARYAAHRNFEPLESSVLDLAPSPSSVVGRTAERARLHRHIQTLPVDFQIALELAYWEGLKAREIAQVFDIPEGTVRSRLRLAKERLRHSMQQDPQNED